MPLFGSQVLGLCGPKPWKPRSAIGAFPLLCHAAPGCSWLPINLLSLLLRWHSVLKCALSLIGGMGPGHAASIMSAKW